MGAHQVRKDQQEHMVLNIQIFNNKRKKKTARNLKKAQTVNKKDASAPFLLRNLLDFFFLPARMGGGRESGGERSKLRGGWKNLPRVSLRGPTPFVFLPNRLLSLEKKKTKKVQKQSRNESLRLQDFYFTFLF